MKAKQQQKRVAMAFAGVLALLVVVLYGAYDNRREARLTAESAAETRELADHATELERATGVMRQQLDTAIGELEKLRPASGSTQNRELYAALDSVQKSLNALPVNASADYVSGRDVRGMSQDLNDSSAATRKAAGSLLARDHRSNPDAITAVLDTLSDTNLPQLSAAGRINSLYFLSRSDPAAWTPEHKRLAEQAIKRIRDRAASGVAIGSQTDAELRSLQEKIDGLTFAPRTP
jgi:hypothetical protein